jgi:hypothetical protein
MFPHGLSKIFSVTNLLIFLLYSNSSAQQEMNRDEFLIKQKKFILSLREEQRYFDCISETQRLLYYDTGNNEKYEFFINACYYSGMQYKTVIRRFFDAQYKALSILPENLFLLWHSFYNTGNSAEARDLLFNTSYDIFGSRHFDLFKNRLEFLTREFEFNNITQEIKKVKPFINSDDNIFLLNELSDDAVRYSEINIKSKWLSASLSAVIPGSGQMYSGKIIHGLISMASIAGSAGIAYYFHEKNERSLVFTFSFLTGLFYAGNIYGAWNSAVSTNLKNNREFSEFLIKKYNLDYDPMRDINIDIFK